MARVLCTSARAFRRLVNMSPGELRRWGARGCSDKSRLERLAVLKKKRQKDWTEADCELATEAVAQIQRHATAAGHTCEPAHVGALRAWGHRAKNCATPRKCPIPVAPLDFIDPDQMRKGIEHEHEHTKDDAAAAAIAADHLVEIPDYYDRLDTLEEDAKRERGMRGLGEASAPARTFRWGRTKIKPVA